MEVMMARCFEALTQWSWCLMSRCWLYEALAGVAHSEHYERGWSPITMRAYQA